MGAISECYFAQDFFPDVLCAILDMVCLWPLVMWEKLFPVISFFYDTFLTIFKHFDLFLSEQLVSVKFTF